MAYYKAWVALAQLVKDAPPKLQLPTTCGYTTHNRRPAPIGTPKEECNPTPTGRTPLARKIQALVFFCWTARPEVFPGIVCELDVLLQKYKEECANRSARKAAVPLTRVRSESLSSIESYVRSDSD